MTPPTPSEPNPQVLRTVAVRPRYGQQRNAQDWLFALLVLAGGVLALLRYRHFMDGYEQAILLGAVPCMVFLGWFWRPAARLMLMVSACALIGIWLYQGDLQRAEQVFWLKYFLSSQSALLWMGVLVFMSALFHWGGLFAPQGQEAGGNTAQRIGSWLAWGAVGMALIGTLVRWYESYHIGAGVGHIPVSNLYEVFVLFVWMTLLFGLYFEDRYRTRGLSAFVLLVVSAAVGFLLWYATAREAQNIQPLVPALQSWWMKLHVPANFVGYGMFALAAMVAYAYLLKTASARALWLGLVGTLGVLAVGVLLLAQWGGAQDRVAGLHQTARLLAVLAGVFALPIAGRHYINPRTPTVLLMDDVMYKAIAIGFAFFTIATVLGALWAAQAWGTYWQWDPKETWALVVWLNYAIWLHLRLMKGLRGKVAAWWALVGLVIVTFAFIGVNMFLSGLHSYGKL